MKRQLSQKVKWDEASMALEQLDWDRDPEHFDRLCQHVINKLNAQLKGKSVEEIVPLPKLRIEIRRAAQRFEEKHISLPFFVYMWLKEVVAAELRKAKK